MWLTILAGLFGISFLSATLLPAQSELALAAVLAASQIPVWLAILVAWIGNTAGSCVNWLLGLFITRFENRKWFPVSRNRLNKAQIWYEKYGRWSLLLSWAPVIGDPITLVAGILKEKFLPFLVLVAVSKLARYMLIACLTEELVKP